MRTFAQTASFRGRAVNQLQSTPACLLRIAAATHQVQAPRRAVAAMASSVPDKMRAWESPEPEKGVAGMAQTDSRPVAHPVQPEGSDPPSVTIKINAAALNPVDYHVIGAMGSMVKSWPFTTGCDMAGTVAEVASGSKWNVGDRVWAFTGVGFPHSGTLAEYCLVPDDMIGKVCDAMKFEDAATLGVGSLTAALGLYRHLGLKLDAGAGGGAEAVLVYGASSSVGCYAVQLAKLSGYRVVAVASTRNHEYLKGLGADQTVDYKDSDWVGQIAAEPANKGMRVALDAVCKNSTGQCFEALEKCGGSGAVVTTTSPRMLLSEAMQAKPQDALKDINLATAYYDAQRPAVVEYVARVSEWVAAGKIKPNRVKVAGGLEAGKQALQDLQDGKVSGEKLVVKVCE